MTTVYEQLTEGPIETNEVTIIDCQECERLDQTCKTCANDGRKLEARRMYCRQCIKFAVHAHYYRSMDHDGFIPSNQIEATMGV